MAITRKALAVRREERAWELSLAGYTQLEITERLAAEGLGRVSQQAVSLALKRVAERLRADLDDRAEREKARQYACLRLLYGEAMRAWYRSKAGRREIRQKAFATPAESPDGAGRPTVVYTLATLRETCGDALYLKRALEALAAIRQLLGLNAPPARVTIAPDVGPTDGGTGGVMIWLPDNGREPLPDEAAGAAPGSLPAPGRRDVAV